MATPTQVASNLQLCPLIPEHQLFACLPWVDKVMLAAICIICIKDGEGDDERQDNVGGCCWWWGWRSVMLMLIKLPPPRCVMQWQLSSRKIKRTMSPATSAKHFGNRLCRWALPFKHFKNAIISSCKSCMIQITTRAWARLGIKTTPTLDFLTAGVGQLCGRWVTNRVVVVIFCIFYGRHNTAIYWRWVISIFQKPPWAVCWRRRWPPQRRQETFNTRIVLSK